MNAPPASAHRWRPSARAPVMAQGGGIKSLPPRERGQKQPGGIEDNGSRMGCSRRGRGCGHCRPFGQCGGRIVAGILAPAGYFFRASQYGAAPIERLTNSSALDHNPYPVLTRHVLESLK